MVESGQELLNSTYTKDNLHRKIMLLEEFYGNYFFKDHKDGTVKERFKNFLLDEGVGEYLRGTLLTLSDNFFATFTAENFRNSLEEIKKEEENYPHITIYVATVLPPIEVEKLGKWARSNIAPSIFLDLEIDSKAVGGCSFVWNGVYHDYSLGYYIDKNRTEIRSLLK